MSIFNCMQEACRGHGFGAKAGAPPLSAVPLLRRRLGLWRPDLEVPFPPLQPAIFPPPLPELPAPALELFDLDEAFAGPLVRAGSV